MQTENFDFRLAVMQMLNDSGAPLNTPGDCSPRFEAIIGQSHYAEIFLYDDDGKKVYVVAVGTLKDHAWLEDDNVRKDETYAVAAFETFLDALSAVVRVTNLFATHMTGFDEV